MRHLLPRWPRREARQPAAVRGEYVPTYCMALPPEPPVMGTVHPCGLPADHAGRHIADATLHGALHRGAYTWPNTEHLSE